MPGKKKELRYWEHELVALRDLRAQGFDGLQGEIDRAYTQTTVLRRELRCAR